MWDRWLTCQPGIGWLLRFCVAVAMCLGMLSGAPLHAQTTVTADWTNLGLGNFGAVPNGATLTAGPRTITVEQSSVTDGGTFVPSYSTDFVSYYGFDISTQTGPLLYNFDNNRYDPDDKVISTFTFDQAVSGLAFRLLHVDRGTTAWDAVEVYYDTGNGTFQNAATNPLFYTTGSANARTNNSYVNGFTGTSASGLTSTAGDIAFSFGTTQVKRIRIVYFSGEQNGNSDPAGNAQYIGLSDMTFAFTGTFADLSLTKTVSSATPSTGSTITYTLSLTAATGSAASSNVTVRDILPPGASFVSSSGYGTYNSATGIWTVASITAGQTRQLTITAQVTASSGATITNTAEIWTAPNFDLDSTPGNGVTTEDDYASVSFTVAGTQTAGTPPTLICPRGSTLFDWDTRAWTAGSTSNSYAVTNIGTIGFNITSQAGFASQASLGGQTPALAGSAVGGNTGGLPGTQLSLHLFIDFTTQSQTSTTTITLPTAVPGLQFTIFDVDFAANDFADKVTVTGTFSGASVTPTLTNGSANYVAGNVAIGTTGSDANQANGNVVVTFASAVDTITIVYGNHTTAPADPDGQAIAIHDITFCNPQANIQVSKTSISYNNGTDPVYALPGNDMVYTISVTNTGTGTLTSNSMFIVDPLPANVTFFNGDANGSAPGTDPVNFTDASSGLTFTYATDVRYATSAPASFAACTYTPAAGYDANVKYICINPKGAMRANTGTPPGFSVSFRSRIK